MNEKCTRSGAPDKKRGGGAAGTNEQATTIISHLFIPGKKRHYTLTVNKNAFVIGPTARGLAGVAGFMTNQPPGFIVAYTENYNCI